MKQRLKRICLLVLFLSTFTFFGCDNSSDSEDVPETGIRFYNANTNVRYNGVRFGTAVAQPLNPGFTGYMSLTPGTYTAEVINTMGNWETTTLTYTVQYGELLVLEAKENISGKTELTLYRERAPKSVKTSESKKDKQIILNNVGIFEEK